jgi:hypothetical protein
MGLVIASLLAILSVEYLHRVPLIACLKLLMHAAGRSIVVIRSRRISDHWKERVLLRYAKDAAIHTFFLGVILLGLFMLVVLLALLMDYIFRPNPSVIQSFSNLTGLSIITIISLVYAFVRHRLYSI